MKRRSMLLAACAARMAQAAPEGLDAQPGVSLPLDLPFTDSEGRVLRLADCFDARHCVLLVPGYYSCPQLCGLVMHALLEGLQRSGVPRASWRIVGISIDARDTPASARARREADLAYADFVAGAQPGVAPLDLRLLVGAPDAIAAFTQAIGYRFAANAQGPRYAHPAAVLVATPAGRVSRTLAGLQFDAGELRGAIDAARAGAIGGADDRVPLPCGHPEPRQGRHDALVLGATRGLGLAVAAGLAAWCWRRRQP